MRVDGKAIAERIFSDLREKIKEENLKPSLGVAYVGSDPVIDNFVSIKKRKGEEIGIRVEILKFDSAITEGDLIAEIKKGAESGKYNGIIVQLPLPTYFDSQNVLNAVPKQLDVDVLGEETLRSYVKGDTSFIPPVAGAIEEILKVDDVNLTDKKIVVIGKGKLVGHPVHLYLKKIGLPHQTLDEYSDISLYLPIADVVISGTGVPGLIQPSFLKQGVVLLDAGTSEKAGKIKGDADPSCEEKCALFTPVPGGIGPITVAILFRNLIAGK